MSHSLNFWNDFSYSFLFQIFLAIDTLQMRHPRNADADTLRPSKRQIQINIKNQDELIDRLTDQLLIRMQNLFRPLLYRSADGAGTGE